MGVQTVVVPGPIWAWLEERARQLDELHAQSGNTRPWAPGRNLAGQAGEWLYGTLTRQPMKPVRPNDGGTDFPGVDVKASCYFDDPHLRLVASETPKANRYFLAAADLPSRRVRPVGYATRQMILEAPLRDYGNGPARVLTEPELLPLDYRPVAWL